MKNKYVLLFFVMLLLIGLTLLLKPETELDKSVQIDKIVVEKRKRQMHVYYKDQLIKSYKISIGKNPIGDKEFEGDKKTPEGLYFINDKNSKSQYYKNLGISYPNTHDVLEANSRGKNPGGQIKIHGLRNGLSWIGKFHRLVNWTAGCIAVTNKEIDELFDSVKIGTPVEIKK